MNGKERSKIFREIVRDFILKYEIVPILKRRRDQKKIRIFLGPNTSNKGFY